ncbi:MAG: VWA domain-containing protein [Polyangiaceae bacterium]|nr:VWA domain-containing protein [Polyangiaceae bacterium]
MRPINVAFFSALGMMLTSISVYSLTPAGGSSARVEPEAAEPVAITQQIAGDPQGQTELARFTAGSTLMLEGRVGHPKLAKRAGETFLMLEVRGDRGGEASAQAPVNLSLVIDRSGSMRGSRLVNAVQAATTAVDRLNDGDVVSVVAFDTRTSVIVPPTTVGPGTRGRIVSDIRGLTLGGDTCISCGIEEGMALLDRTAGKVTRMILLSDGDANSGVRDVPGFRSMAQRARDRGVSITTIGVDVEYNEKILSAIAQESNGRHYFVESDAALARIFEAEAESLTSTVASGAEVAIDLAPGVELDRVFDRSFRRAGSKVIVPLGSFSQGEVKTVLLRVRLNGQQEGEAALADVEMTYRDLVADAEGRCAGKLGVEITEDPAAASDLDAVVAGRVQRSETAAALKQANFLFQQGRVDEARRKLESRTQALQDVAKKAKTAAPASRAKDVERDFDGQVAALEDASSGFATPTFATPPAAAFGGSSPQAAAAPAAAAPPQESRQGKSAVRLNEQNATSLGF